MVLSLRGIDAYENEFSSLVIYLARQHSSCSTYGMSKPRTAQSWTTRSVSRPTTSLTRPGTTQSRPITARPQTAASTRYESSWITAVFEGRGITREVGLAALDRETGKVALVQVCLCRSCLPSPWIQPRFQLSDCQTYVKTLHQMHLHSPSLILLPDTSFSRADVPAGALGKGGSSTSMLLQYIREEFPGVPIEPIARRYWNENGGWSFLYVYALLS
jgi:DNA mismatch repair protein MSH4